MRITVLSLCLIGIQRGANLFAYTSLLDQKIALEKKLILIKAEYPRTQAKLKSLTGTL